jgi:hypothetical protein
MKIFVMNSSSHSSYILAEVIFFVHVYHSHKEASKLVILFAFLKRTLVWFSLHPGFVQLIVLS